MGAGGSGPTRLTSDFADVEPAWSPDGTRIVFARLTVSETEEATDSGLYVIQADGTNLTKLASGPEGTTYESPSWSRDGTKLAFASDATATSTSTRSTSSPAGSPS